MKDWVVDPCPDRPSCCHADEEIGCTCVDLDWGSDVSALLLAGRASHAQVAIVSEDKYWTSIGKLATGCRNPLKKINYNE